MKLTDNWCIQGGEELAKWMSEHAKIEYSNKIGNVNGWYYWLENPPSLSRWEAHNFKPQGRTVITVKQLEEMIAETNQEKTMEKRILGYCCPTDLYGGVIKKNSLYTAFGHKDRYCPDHDYCPRNIAPIEFALPKEIVETWEKVFEEEKITICDKEVVIRPNGIEINGVTYHRADLLIIKDLMNRGQIKSLNVGCNGQEQVDLKLIEKILAKL